MNVWKGLYLEYMSDSYPVIKMQTTPEEHSDVKEHFTGGLLSHASSNAQPCTQSRKDRKVRLRFRKPERSWWGACQTFLVGVAMYWGMEVGKVKLL